MNLSWHDIIGDESQQPYFQETLSFIKDERVQGKVIYPPEVDVFNAFKLTEFSEIKVVILGQDPYHGPNQAHGLCFSVLPGIKVPPSLMNIYKELAEDIDGFAIPTHGFLESWAEQGVLMLNTVLTVEEGKAHSHAKKTGWETYTSAVIEAINHYHEGVVFMLWGAHAQKKGKAIDRNKHCVLTAPHPSPLSAHRGFLGCRHFSMANQYLLMTGKEAIHWAITEP
ncbi:uracil-DNA glycosylase [Vibrio sp.]|nr:uracil-DNA glycosylase [Vibrio sp.]